MATAAETRNCHCLICNVTLTIDAGCRDIFRQHALSVRLEAILQVTLFEGTSQIRYICLNCEQHVISIENYNKILEQFRKNFAHTCSYHGIQLAPVAEASPKKPPDVYQRPPPPPVQQQQQQQVVIQQGQHQVVQQNQTMQPASMQQVKQWTGGQVETNHPLTFTVVGISEDGFQVQETQRPIGDGQSNATQLLQTQSIQLQGSEGRQLEEILLCLDQQPQVQEVQQGTIQAGASGDVRTFYTNNANQSQMLTVTQAGMRPGMNRPKIGGIPRRAKKKENGVSGGREFGCTLCDKFFLNQAHLKQHFRTHTGERPYKCGECAATFTMQSNLKRHMLKHTGQRPYACKLCPLSYTQSGHLKRHMRTHDGIRPFKCTHCERAFMWEHEFQEHQRFHSGERPFVCPVCNNDFARRRCFKEHLKIHSSERPFQCADCSAAFVRKNDYVIHRRRHTGEKPYSCDLCPRKFAKASWLVSHKKNHSTETLECPTCNASFNKMVSLKLHQRTHQNAEEEVQMIKIKCTYCNLSFKNRERMQAHVGRKHAVAAAAAAATVKKKKKKKKVGVTICTQTDDDPDTEYKVILATTGEHVLDVSTGEVQHHYIETTEAVEEAVEHRTSYHEGVQQHHDGMAVEVSVGSDVHTISVSAPNINTTFQGEHTYALDHAT